jgi:hypothetical protein
MGRRSPVADSLPSEEAKASNGESKTGETEAGSFEQRGCPGRDSSRSIRKGGKAFHGCASAEQRCKGKLE